MFKSATPSEMGETILILFTNLMQQEILLKKPQSQNTSCLATSSTAEASHIKSPKHFIFPKQIHPMVECIRRQLTSVLNLTSLYAILTYAPDYHTSTELGTTFGCFHQLKVSKPHHEGPFHLFSNLNKEENTYLEEAL